MAIISVIGVDPGEVTGICFLDYSDIGVLQGKTLIQVDAPSACVVLSAMLFRYYVGDHIVGRAAAVEAWREGPAAARKTKSAGVTRQLVMELTEMLQTYQYRVSVRAAADVKPWASDKRLIKAGIVEEAAHGMWRHSNDAVRHALFSAVKDRGIRDPLA